MADGKTRIYSLPEVTEVNSDMYIMLDSSATGTRKYNLKTMYDKVDGVEDAAEAAEAATETATTAASQATSAANAATSAASSAQSTVQSLVANAQATMQGFMADATETMDGLVDDVNDALEAIGDISEQAVPLMSPTTRGGAKLGHGLTVEDGALGLGEVTDPTDAGPIVELTAKGWATQDTTVDPPSPSPSYPQEIRRVTGHTISGKTGRYVDILVTHDGTTTTIPIPLPSRGWVAALPDGTADTLTLDGAGGYVWTLAVGGAEFDGDESWSALSSWDSSTQHCYSVANAGGKLTSTSKPLSSHYKCVTYAEMTSGKPDNSICIASQGNVLNLLTSESTLADFKTWLASNPITVLYPLATPTTERGYTEMFTVPIHAAISSADLVDLTVRCCADDGAAEIASAWGKRYVETSTEMQSDVVEIATGLATLEDGVADLSASIADLTDVVAYHDERIERNASDIASMRKSLLRRESDGYYDNQSVTAFLSAKFDGRLYGYSEPKTTATEVTKTGANAGIPNPTLGTATVAGTSEYRDLGPFQWFAAKGYVDADGVPHVKTIRGIDSDADWDACTDNVWSLRPVVWYSVDESGSSVIGSLSDTWHLGLSPNPQAYLPDGTLRPYMLAARYALGFENGVGVSKSGLKGYGRDVSHNSLITKLGYASSGYSGKSIYEQWYDVFMSRMIYGTKDFQTVMQGCTSYTYQYNPAVAETGVKRVILTNAQAAGLLVGSTMMLGTRVGASSNDRNQANNFDVFDGARITAIEEYDANNKAVYFDVDETFDTDPTYLLSTAPWHSGSCDAMDWDGSPTSPQSAKEVAFFQGCELMHGATEILAGVIISNDGVTGWTPYVVHDTRDDATSLTEDFVSCGAALPTNDSDGWKYPLYVSDHGGLMYGTTTGGSSTTGASDSHYTNKLATTGVREWRSSGNLSNGRLAGPSYVIGGDSLGISYWYFWSRLSGTGRSRG